MSSIIRITTNTKGFNGKIYKSFYQCYSGKRTDYHYEVYSCTNKGEERLGGRSNLKLAMVLFNEHLEKFKTRNLCPECEATLKECVGIDGENIFDALKCPNGCDLASHYA